MQTKRTKSNIFSLNQKCLIIAEIGVNHNGNLRLAKESIHKAKQAGADAVKFQTFTAEKLASKLTPKVKYQKMNSLKSETHFDMLKKLELSKSDHVKIKNYCKKIGIIFLSTPYDIDSAKFLIKLGVDFIKTSSADIVDLPLHEFIAKKKNQGNSIRGHTETLHPESSQSTPSGADGSSQCSVPSSFSKSPSMWSIGMWRTLGFVLVASSNK